MKINISKLEQIRERKRLSKTAFSFHLGLDPSTYRKIIGSKDGESVTVKTLNRIANALHLNPVNLLSR